MRPCLALAALLLSASASVAGPETGTSFFDDFEVFNRGIWAASDGWANGDWMNCEWSRDLVQVAGGMLTLGFDDGKAASRAYRCAEVQSRLHYGFGTYEVRMRTGRGSGLNAAFFGYTGPHFGAPHHEIDVEVLLRDPGSVSLNTYIDGTPRNGGVVVLPEPADRDFVIYAFTWTRDGVRWFVDGVEVHRTAPGTPVPSEPQKIFASLWGSDTMTDWMGPFDPKASPQELQIDWIGFTAEGDGCRFAQSILCGGD